MEILEGSVERFPEHVVISCDEEKGFTLQEGANLFDFGFQLFQRILFRLQRALVGNHAHCVSSLYELAKFVGNGRVLKDHLAEVWLLMGHTIGFIEDIFLISDQCSVHIEQCYLYLLKR